MTGIFIGVGVVLIPFSWLAYDIWKEWQFHKDIARCDGKWRREADSRRGPAEEETTGE